MYLSTTGLIILIILLGVPICVRRHPKWKQPNLFQDVGLIDERADLDFLMEPEVGKIVSKSAKIVRDGLDIRPSFQFVYDDSIHSEEL